MAVKREFSAGGVVFKKVRTKIFVVIYKPESRDTWQLPKGWIDAGEKSEDTAVREVREETGIEGEIIQKIDTIKFFFNWEGQKILKTVTFYLMRYLSGSVEDHGWEAEKAEWTEIDEAIDRLTFRSEKELVKKAKELIVKNG